MNKSRKPFSLSEAKIQASILLKLIRSNDSEKKIRAAKRFQRLPELALLSIEETLKTPIQHKHALAVIAMENGFASWTDLKIQSNFIIGGYLNHWFANYAEAKAFLEKEGGFLLPYKNQFFICNANYILQIGFNPNDPDWKLIAYDWANPKNQPAWQRLYRNWIAKKGERHE